MKKDLYNAVYYSNTKDLQALLSQNTINEFINASIDEEGNTLLHVAATTLWAPCFAHLHIIELLIKHGATVNAVNKSMITPLHLAAKCAGTELAKLLIERGANVNAKSSNGTTPIHMAVTKSDIYSNGHILVHNHNVHMTRLLLEPKNNPDVNIANNEGNTPLHLAIDVNSEEIVDMLLAAKADVLAKNRDDRTPLHRCALKGNVAIGKKLLDAGASIDVTDKYGCNPVETATIQRKTLLSRFLMLESEFNRLSNINIEYSDKPQLNLGSTNMNN